MQVGCMTGPSCIVPGDIYIQVSYCESLYGKKESTNRIRLPLSDIISSLDFPDSCD